MKILIISLLCKAFLVVVQGVICNQTCTLTQICATDGLCYERSELVKCSEDNKYVHYCRKGDDCCDDDCMPLGGDCCSRGKYCDVGYTCCNGVLCCHPGTFCDNAGSCKESTNVRWWHVVIIVAVIAASVVGVFLWRRRRTRIRVNNECGRVVMVHGNPAHTPIQSTTILGHTHGQIQNGPVIITK